ncbi:F0F1 ATP synthase subunit B family protein [Hyphomicrobium sp.]|uniref:F0F1 ATP synthase subunit B family protein n=1 Tax=Hyphomicrobium sp. TaxID=82 RepID=UPI003F6F1C99
MLNPAYPEFWVLLSFLLFVGLLIWKGVPGIVGRTLDARANAIRTELDEARRLRDEAQQLLADYQRKAREAEGEAKSIIDAAKREAESLAAETRRALTEQVERRTKAAEEKIARAEAQAISDVRAAAVDLAVKASETILQAKMAGEAGGSLTETAIRDLKGKLN